MAVIFKYEINQYNQEQVLVMPKQREFLHLGIQNGSPFMWFKVKEDPVYNPDESMNDLIKGDFEEVVFRIFATGEVFQSEKYKYIGTFQMPPFVWHIHEKINQDS